MTKTEFKVLAKVDLILSKDFTDLLSFKILLQSLKNCMKLSIP